MSKNSNTKIYVIIGIAAALVFVICAIGIIVIGDSDSQSSNKFIIPSDTPTISQTTNVPEQVETDPVVTEKPKVNNKFSKLSVREWKKISKNPTTYIGKQYVIYGVVTQFDSSTGSSAFRANVDAVKHKDWFEYETNTILDDNGVTGSLDSLVQDDQFSANIIVNGELSYETTLGEELSVPHLSVVSFKII